MKQIINSETKEVKDIEIKTNGIVISKETSEKVLSMMESVVSEGTGKNAKVAGYRIGGKTGTSEDGVNTNKYVTSFCGVAPIDNPQIVILVTLYNPTGEGGHQGGAWVILTTHCEIIYKSVIALIIKSKVGAIFTALKNKFGIYMERKIWYNL